MTVENLQCHSNGLHYLKPLPIVATGYLGIEHDDSRLGGTHGGMGEDAMTRKAKKTGKELERRVADAYRKMGAKKVEHDVELAGNQIDIYCCNSNHRIPRRCKDVG